MENKNKNRGLKKLKKGQKKDRGPQKRKKNERKNIKALASC